jgi:hypothetical protein
MDMFAKPKAKKARKGRKTRKNSGTKAGGQKAAKTRKRNAAKRSTAARKGARTRAANHSKRSRAAKRGARKGGKRRARKTRPNTGGVSVARVAKVERKLTQVVKTQHVQGAKITKLGARVTRLDGARKALGLPSGGGSLRKAEDLLQDRAVALELAARRKNPKRGKKRKGAKRGKRRGSKRGKKR